MFIANNEVKILTIGTLNVQGCQDEVTKKFLYEDTLRYDLQVLGLTETHVNDETTKTIKIKHGGAIRYISAESKVTTTFSGTGIIVEESLKPYFKRISDRISSATIKLDSDHHLNIVTAYAPTLEQSEKDPQIREDFYNDLDQITSQHQIILTTMENNCYNM